MRRVQQEPKQDNPRYLCGKCTGCNMMGSHKEDQCWVLNPHLKPKDSGNNRGGKDRGRRRDRTRSKVRKQRKIEPKR